MKNKRATIQSAMVSAPVIKPAELDFDVIKRLYEFGGLYAYKVMYFDPISFSTKRFGEMTFNEEKAKEVADGLIRNGFKVDVFQDMVHFDGKWSKGKKG